MQIKTTVRTFTLIKGADNSLNVTTWSWDFVFFFPSELVMLLVENHVITYNVFIWSLKFIIFKPSFSWNGPWPCPSILVAEQQPFDKPLMDNYPSLMERGGSPWVGALRAPWSKVKIKTDSHEVIWPFILFLGMYSEETTQKEKNPMNND